MAKFSYAWHTASDTMMDTGDVAEFFLKTGQAPELMCPDITCRQEAPSTRIIPVCCDPRKPCAASSPHFRTASRQRHGENCQFQVLSQHTDYILKHKYELSLEFPNANILLDVEGIASELIPDMYVKEFRPQEFMDEIQKKTREYQRAGARRDDASRKARCAVPQRTGKFSTVVDMALKLEEKGGEEALSEAKLLLPDRRESAPYQKIFFNIRFLKERYFTSYIFFGEAHIHETHEGFLVEYMHKLKAYNESYPEMPACTPITYEECSLSLRNDLHAYAASGRPCCAYSFSTHTLHESDCPILNTPRCVVFRPKIRGAVAIREKVLKEKQYRQP